jgi:hypothetical protein
MRLGRKKHSTTPTNDDDSEASSANNNTGDAPSITSKSSTASSTRSGRRKLGSRVKGLFKRKKKKKNKDDDPDEFNTPKMAHPAAGLTHEMLGIKEEDEEDNDDEQGDGNGKNNNMTADATNLDSKDPMDQVSEMEGGVNDKYLGSNFKDIDVDVNSIIVVLLLIDPKTLRFELLQLEFDSRTATVLNALQQIPDSATEFSIKSQVYKCVIDGQLKQQSGKTLLKSFATSKDVLVAMATKQSLEDASRLARPILCDPKVVTMVRYVKHIT